MGERPDLTEIVVIVGDAVRLARCAWKPVALALIFGIGAGVVIDCWMDPRAGAAMTGVFGLVYLYFQVLITALALRAAGRTPAGWSARQPTMGRYPAAFALQFLWLVGVLFGLLLLIVPGLIFALRWSVGLPALIGEKRTVADALRRSWSLTRNQPVLLLFYGALVVAGYAAAFFVILRLYPEYGEVGLASALAANGLLSLAQVFGWLLTTALYLHLSRDKPADTVN